MIGTNNITTDIVKTTLGENSHSISNLCMSDKINKWSFYKPVHKTTYEPLTDADFYSVNDGFQLDNSMFLNAVKLWNSYIKNPDIFWKYEPTSGYNRIGDFRNYNHEARNWFNLETRITQETEITASKGSSVQLEFTENTDLQSISQFGFYPASQDLDFGFLFYSSNSEARTINYYKQCELLDFEKMIFKVPENTTDTELYILPVFSTDRRVQAGGYYTYNVETIESGEFYLLPSNKVKIIISSGGTTTDINIEWLIDLFAYTYNDYVYEFTKLPFKIENGTNTTKSVNYLVEFNDINHTKIQNSVSVNANSTVEIDLCKKEILRLFVAIEALTMTITINVNGQTKTISYTLNKEKKNIRLPNINIETE